MLRSHRFSPTTWRGGGNVDSSFTIKYSGELNKRRASLPKGVSLWK